MAIILEYYLIPEEFIALEGQNIDAFKSQIDARINVFRKAKREGKAFERAGDYKNAYTSYMYASNELKHLATQIYRTPDDVSSLVIGHIVSITSQLAKIFLGLALYKKVLNHNYRYNVQHNIPDPTNNLQSRSISTEMSAAFSVLIIAIQSIGGMFASIKEQKFNRKERYTTNPIKKNAINAIMAMSQIMKTKALKVKRKGASLKNKSTI